MTHVRGTADLDREAFVYKNLTARQLGMAAIPAGLSLMCLIASSAMKALSGNSSPETLGVAGLLAVAAVVIAAPRPKGFMLAFRRAHLGPRTYVNGPVTTLPKELQTRSYRKAQKRLATLSAPFEGFDEAGRYLVGGGACRVLKVNPIDMDLRSERERDILGKRFAHLLSTQDGAMIPLVTGEPISFAAEAIRLRGLQVGAQVARAAADYAAFLETLSGSRRQTYVACWGTDGLAADLRSDHVSEQLRRMGLDVHRPTPTEMAALTALLSGGQVPHRAYPAVSIAKGS